MSLNGVNVFLVEDEALLSMFLEDMLTELGCKVTDCASSLTEAIKMAETGSFDCALLDVNLNGREVFPVAEILDQRGIPFAFSSGYGASALPQAFTTRPVVAKPFDMRQLAAVMQTTLAQKAG